MSRLPTSQHTIGPFFPRTFFRPGDNDLTRITTEAEPSRRGERILLRGRVVREGSVPCVNALVEAWQADAAGRFRHPADPEQALADPDFLGWGRAWTDAEGGFEFNTLLPGGYAEGNHHRAPHVNLTIMASGLMRPLATTFFFPDFPAENAADPVLALVPAEARARLLAQPLPEVAGLRGFRIDLRLRGEARRRRRRPSSSTEGRAFRGCRHRGQGPAGRDARQGGRCGRAGRRQSGHGHGHGHGQGQEADTL